MPLMPMPPMPTKCTGPILRGIFMELFPPARETLCEVGELLDRVRLAQRCRGGRCPVELPRITEK